MKLPTLLLALFIPAALTAADPLQPLRQALTFHASFDQGFDADFSRGEKRMQFAGVPKGQAAGPGEFIKIAPGAGDRKSTRLNSSHSQQSRMPSSA